MTALACPDKTNLFAVADECIPVPTDTNSPLELARSISDASNGQKARLEKIFQHYSRQKYLILLTGARRAEKIEEVWRKKEKPKNAKMIVWKLGGQSYRTSSCPDIIYFYGYSEELLNSVKNMLAEI